MPRSPFLLTTLANSPSVLSPSVLMSPSIGHIRSISAPCMNPVPLVEILMCIYQNALKILFESFIHTWFNLCLPRDSSKRFLLCAMCILSWVLCPCLRKLVFWHTTPGSGEEYQSYILSIPAIFHIIWRKNIDDNNLVETNYIQTFSLHHTDLTHCWKNHPKHGAEYCRHYIQFNYWYYGSVNYWTSYLTSCLCFTSDKNIWFISFSSLKFCEPYVVYMR